MHEQTPESGIRNTVPVPRKIFDVLLPTLTDSELRVLLVVTRQTLGFREKSGSRKKRDWITNSFFRKKSGRASASVSRAIERLVKRNVITVTDKSGMSLTSPSSRRRHRGKLYYSLGEVLCISSEIQKVKTTKETETKFIYKGRSSGPRRLSSGWTRAAQVYFTGKAEHD